MRYLLEAFWVYHWAFWVIGNSFHRHDIGASRTATDRYVEAGTLRENMMWCHWHLTMVFNLQLQGYSY